MLEQREEVYEKIAQFLQLKNVIERLQVTLNCFQYFMVKYSADLCDSVAQGFRWTVGQMG